MATELTKTLKIIGGWGFREEADGSVQFLDEYGDPEGWTIDKEDFKAISEFFAELAK